MGTRYLGLISGTSVDGVDACVAEFRARRCRIVSARTTPYPIELRERVQALITAPQAALREIGGVDIALGRFFGACALSLIRDAGLAPSDIAAIGHHGQTVFHAPTGAEPFSMQLGDPNSVAALTGITTVTDFRRRDIAHGGQGAPLVPAFHDWLWRTPRETRVIVNIGGIANVTIIRPGKPTIGFDTGPGNTLLDAWIQRCRGQAYDADGAWASRGNVDDEWLRALLREPYFSSRPPKSTGREHFNLAWLEQHAGTAQARLPEDVQATLAELTAATIVAAIANSGVRKYRLIICGGGARNGDLLLRLGRLSGRDPDTTAAHGVPPDFVEAAAFAWLARARLLRAAGNVPSVTGARQTAILGGVYYGGEPDRLARDRFRSGRAKSKTA
ncbi:MAG TPA: anhydro-N-acetylmuramic acid kinase [Gammaproteobacteria bacterium]|jgi:anhydro-N-acetylmuramic acid kinase